MFDEIWSVVEIQTPDSPVSEWLLQGIDEKCFFFASQNYVNVVQIYIIVG